MPYCIKHLMCGSFHAMNITLDMIVCLIITNWSSYCSLFLYDMEIKDSKYLPEMTNPELKLDWLESKTQVLLNITI